MSFAPEREPPRSLTKNEEIVLGLGEAIFTTLQASKRTGLHISSVVNACTRLSKRGLLERVDKSTWRLI